MNVQNPVNSNKHQFQPNIPLSKDGENSKTFDDDLQKFHIAHEPSMRRPALEFLLALMDDIISHASQTNQLSSFTLTSDDAKFQQHIHQVHPYGEQCLFALGFQKNLLPERVEYILKTADTDLVQKLHEYKKRIQNILENDLIAENVTTLNVCCFFFIMSIIKFI
jgi:hypothetical protein